MDKNSSFFAWISLLLLAMLSQFGCRDQKPLAPPPAADTPAANELTIVAVGDSLTAGNGLFEEQSYPAQLQRKLQADGHRVRVVNAGVSGETSSGTLARLGWVLTMKPDIVILETGANDGLRGIDPAVPRANIREILRILEQQKIVTVLAGMKMVWNMGPVYISTFNKIYPELAAETGVIFMPFFLADVATVAALNNEDGLHPNEQGYTKIVTNIYPYVIEAINQATKKSQ